MNNVKVVAYQATKHLLVGAAATLIDLSLFEFLIWLMVFLASPNNLVAKGISFILATVLKYFGNKYWAFEKLDRDNLSKEISRFFLITFVGVIIDVRAFYYFIQIPNPPLAPFLWTKVSVILAAGTAAAWNFFGYKFLVFKK